MIDINKLKDSDKGRKVVFSSLGGSMKTGTITNWDNKFIYVDYSKAFLTLKGVPTNPAKLVFKKK